MSSRATVSKAGDREIHVERVFEAPRDRVFAAFIDPERIPEWWGPRRYTTVVEEMDPRPGGKWRFLMRDPDGEETRFSGTYREVEAPERISQTFEWSGMPGRISLETATFEDLGDGRTRVVNVSVFHLAEERESMIESGMESGLNETYERLDEVLAG
jgi:uncharacterized protein YndB with AHSA1/START domain